jgi:hypothetical protein
MKIRFVVLASVIAASGTAYGQNYNNSIGVDVTPKAQVEINTENAKRAAKREAEAEARAEQERQRAAELERATIRAQADVEAARIKAQGGIEAAKRRNPDVCLYCNLRR